jgi:hypothetical protein
LLLQLEAINERLSEWDSCESPAGNSIAIMETDAEATYQEMLATGVGLEALLRLLDAWFKSPS